MNLHTKEADLLKYIESNERIFIHGAACTPQRLVNSLVDRAAGLRNVEIVHLHTEGEPRYAEPQYCDSFTINTFFTGANLRRYTGQSNVQYIPVFLSEIPALFRKNILPLDAALIQVSEPDVHGYCSLGLSVDIARAACDSSRRILALINPNMPRSHGDGQIHVSKFTAAMYASDPVFETESKALSDEEMAIGRNIATLIEDRSTLQMGIGSIPDAVLTFLSGHRDLGIHTEMFSNGILPLVERGVITGNAKGKHRGKIVASFAMGNRRLYNFIHDNPMVAMLDVAYVNNARVIAENPKMVAINSAIEIDLTGQVCSDSIGSRIYSGVGGQMDFIRGASLSEGGRPIIAIASATSQGISKIVPVLKSGAGVVTTRAHVHYVVTEYGIADLYGKNLKQRAKELISIAHPMHRESLERAAFELFH